jgi:hypothetical protein
MAASKAATTVDSSYAHEAGECAEAIKTWGLRDAGKQRSETPVAADNLDLLGR